MKGDKNMSEKFDINSLTAGEVAQIEEKAKQSFTSISDDNAPKGRLFAAIAFVVRKRDNDKVTFNECLDMPLGDIMALIGLDDEEDPMFPDTEG